MRKYIGNRDDEMIGDAIGMLQGHIIKGTLTSANANDTQNWYNNNEKKLRATEAQEWYAKMDVVGMPGYAKQKDRGTPRVIVLIDGNVPLDVAWFTDHYNNFQPLDEGFFKRAKNLKDYLSR